MHGESNFPSMGSNQVNYLVGKVTSRSPSRKQVRMMMVEIVAEVGERGGEGKGKV